MPDYVNCGSYGIAALQPCPVSGDATSCFLNSVTMHEADNGLAPCQAALMRTNGGSGKAVGAMYRPSAHTCQYTRFSAFAPGSSLCLELQSADRKSSRQAGFGGTVKPDSSKT
jgi:hypothetical protein